MEVDLTVLERRVVYVERNGDLRVYDADRDHIHDLGLVGHSLWSTGSDVLFLVDEALSGAQDRNGDGDALDEVLFSLSLDSLEPLNHGLALEPQELLHASGGGVFLMALSENAQGGDFNGDGDMLDNVAHVLDLETLEVQNLGVAMSRAHNVGIRWAMLEVREADQGLDIDGDGLQASDLVFFYDHQEQRLIPTPVFIDFGTGLPLIDGDQVALCLSEDSYVRDFDGDGMLQGAVLFTLDLLTLSVRNLQIQAAYPVSFHRGVLSFAAISDDGSHLLPSTLRLQTGVAKGYGVPGDYRWSSKRFAKDFFHTMDPSDVTNEDEDIYVLDVAGEEVVELGATGRPVGLLGEYLIYEKGGAEGTLRGYSITDGGSVDFGVRIQTYPTDVLPIDGFRALVWVLEEGVDLDGDGALGGEVLHLLRLVPDQP